MNSDLSNPFRPRGSAKNEVMKKLVRQFQHQESLDREFEEVVKKVQDPNLEKVQLDDQTRLKFYAYYKQATQGDIQTSRPFMFQFVERQKWDAWNNVKQMDQNVAKQAYINLFHSYYDKK